MNLLLISLTVFSATGQTTFEPGQSLHSLISPESVQVSISGSMPLDPATAAAPIQPGRHWLAQWSEQQTTPTLTRFSVAGEAQVAVVRQFEIAIDTQPPSARLQWQRDEGFVNAATVGPLMRPKLTATDASGVRTATLLINGEPVSEQAWHTGTVSGPQQFSARLVDVLGNQGEADLGVFELDLDPPQINVEAVDAVAGWVGKPPYRISASATDTSGAAEMVLSVAGKPVCEGSAALECSIKRARFEVAAVDAVGNRSVEQIELQRDTEGPAVSTDPAPESGKMRLRLGETGSIDATDPSGVVYTCIRQSYGRCRALPHSYIAKRRGRYKFWVEARDKFGNRSRHPVKIEVTR